MDTDVSRNRWTTTITDIQTDSIRYRGYSVSDLIGRASYSEVVYLLLTGDLPPRSHARLLDAVIVSSVDHGTTPPSTLAARTAASTGAPLNAALSAGLLSINEFHGGAIEGCMTILHEVAEREHRGEERAVAAKGVVDRYRKEKMRISGLGHRVHTCDPRARRLIEVAEEEGISGEWVDRLDALSSALVSVTGKTLPVNVDGAIAAILKELGIPPAAANALFMIARVPGLVAHIIEERDRERPMRQIKPDAADYVGPTPRDYPRDDPGGP